MRNFRIILFLICPLTIIHCYGQDTLKKHKRFRITPLPVVYYSPETRLGFGALVAANFETIKVPDSVTLSSYAQTYFLYTINKQYDWGTSTRIYSPKNKFIFSGKFNYTYFPEYYFGIATEHPLEKKDTIKYDRLAADLRFYWKLKGQYFAGFATRFNDIGNVDSGVGSLSEDKPLGYTGYWIQGFAPTFLIETRDSFVYPRKGFYLEALYYIYPSWSGNSHNFQSVKLDVRKYYPVKWISDIDALAFQFLANVNTGNVPFKDLADIGGSNTMRGYYTGYYRYKNLYAFQAEYRANVWKRIGFTAWVGAALTPEKWYTFFDHSVKPNAGIGLRLMLNQKDKLNVRVDQGFGKQGQNGFYLDIAEAY
ncbi:MAG TPA: BamA/TamA family outer membrane protein [Cyclobacteriaceae bacterium]